jgi:hypothetical protein
VTGPKKKIMWVHAPAGYGKTAIAGTISKILEEQNLEFKPLGATFFFWRTSPERNSPARFIVTIAYQLAMAIPELGPHIKAAVENRAGILGKDLERQLDVLIVKPFKALSKMDRIPTRLVIIDGLDECINSDQESRLEKAYAADQEKVQRQVLELIHILHSHCLPLCFLILSRPEPWIRKRIEAWSGNVVEVVDLYRVGDHMKDVEKYVRAELRRIAAEHDELVGDEEWPEEDIVQRFVQRTDGHMVYASTVIRHIDDPYHDPRERLKNILNLPSDSNPDLAHSDPFSSLHELYRQIMRSCPESNRLLMVEVLEDIVTATHFFPHDSGLLRALDTLDSLSGRAAGSGARAIRGLHAVLRLVSKDTNPNTLVQLNPFIHSSFVEFLTNPMLSSGFAVDRKKGSRRLLWNCLECMSTITGRWILLEDHLQFTLRSFRHIWAMAWSDAENVKLHQDDYLEVVKKLLTVDLTTCFIQLFRIDWIKFFYLTYGPISLIEQEFVASLELLRKESDPLAEQAIMHVLSSADRAVTHLLRQNRFERGYELKLSLRDYLRSLLHRCEASTQRKPDQVAQALRDARRELEAISCPPVRKLYTMPVGWSSRYIRPILNYIRQNDL